MILGLLDLTNGKDLVSFSFVGDSIYRFTFNLTEFCFSYITLYKRLVHIQHPVLTYILECWSLVSTTDFEHKEYLVDQLYSAVILIKQETGLPVSSAQSPGRSGGSQFSFLIRFMSSEWY
jgi:hypothetical protein